MVIRPRFSSHDVVKLSAQPTIWPRSLMSFAPPLRIAGVRITCRWPCRQMAGWGRPRASTTSPTTVPPQKAMAAPPWPRSGSRVTVGLHGLAAADRPATRSVAWRTAAEACAAALAVASGAESTTAATTAPAAGERGLVRACMTCSLPGEARCRRPLARVATGVAVLLQPSEAALGGLSGDAAGRAARGRPLSGTGCSGRAIYADAMRYAILGPL